MIYLEQTTEIQNIYLPRMEEIITEQIEEEND